MLDVSFVRRRGSRDRVYVTRDDGSSTAWEFASYGDGLPHDLCHLVVEDELGLSEGFWGLIDQGVDVRVVDNQATLMRDATPLIDHVGVDFSGLAEAEAAVAVLAGPGVDVASSGELAVAWFAAQRATTPALGDVARALGFELPASVTPDAIATIATRLQQLAEQWRRLPDGEALKLSFSRGSPDPAGTPPPRGGPAPTSPP
jgi:hypothetical protein